MERILSLMALYLLWVLVPMIPAIVIYSRFPNTAVAASGVLANLTVKAGGAFAAYLIIFVVAKPLIDQIEVVLDEEQVWTILGHIKFVDENGREIRNSLLVNNLTVELKPGEHDIWQDGFRLRVLKRDNQLPHVTLHAPNYVDGNIDPSDTPEIRKIDNFQHTIELNTPVEIRRDSTTLPAHPFGP